MALALPQAAPGAPMPPAGSPAAPGQIPNPPMGTPGNAPGPEGLPTSAGQMPGLAPTLPSLPSPPVDEDTPEYDMRLNLDAKTREDLGRTFARKIRHSMQERSDWDDRVRGFRDQYDAQSTPTMWPWPNAASLNIPTTRAAVDTIHARMLRATTGTNPLFRVECFSPDMSDVAGKIEAVLQWQFNDQIEMPGVWDELYMGGLRDGAAIAMVTWERSISRTRKPGVSTVNGQQVPVLIEEDDYVVNRPAVTPVDVLDFFMYPANAKTITGSIGCGRRVWKTENDLWQGVKDGIYDEKDVQKLLDAKPQRPDRDDETKGADVSRLAAVGLENADPIDEEDRSFEFVEFVWQYDADGDKLKEDCWFELEMSTETLMRSEHYPFWHNQRCFVPYIPYPRPGSFYGYSVPEILEDLHAEINAIRRQRIDAGTLALMPMMLKKRGVRFDSTKQRLRPGITIECDDPMSDIKTFSFQAITQNAFAEEQKAAEMAEQVTGANSYSQGASPSRSRTLGEVNSVLTEGNVKFDVIIGRLHRSNNLLAQLVMGLNRQYLDAQEEFSITNDAGQRIFHTVSKKDLGARVRIVASGNTLNTNKELALQSAETLFQMMNTEPMIGQKPTRRYAVLAHYLHMMGISNVAPIIGSAADAQTLETQQESAPAPPPEPPQVTGRMDEATTLAQMIKEGQITAEEYLQAVQLVKQAQPQPAAAPPGGRPFPPARGSAARATPGMRAAV